MICYFLTNPDGDEGAEVIQSADNSETVGRLF